MVQLIYVAKPTQLTQMVQLPVLNLDGAIDLGGETYSTNLDYPNPLNSSLKTATAALAISSFSGVLTFGVALLFGRAGSWRCYSTAALSPGN